MISRDTIQRGFPIRPLGDVAEFLDSRRRPITASERIPGPYPYYGANGQQDSVADYIFDEPLILLAEDGGLFDQPDRGIAYVIEGKTWVNNHAHVLRPRGHARLRYLVRVLENYDVTPWITGSTRAKLTKAGASKIQIPLPPLAEQKRIAAILDAADALRAKRREALAQLDTLLQSTFLDMFGDPVTNPMDWERCTVGDIVHSAKDGPHVSPKYSDNGIPFLSTRHIKTGEVIWQDLKYIDQDEANRQWKKCKPEFGDILYTKGGTTGIAARVTTSEPFAVWVHVALLKPIFEKVDPAWMEAMLNSAYCYTQSQRYTHGIANRDLGLTRMVKIKIFLPPLDVQSRFAAIVEAVQNHKARQRVHLAELDTLFASLQSRAFRGDL